MGPSPQHHKLRTNLRQRTTSVFFFFYIKNQIFKQLANCLVFREWCKYTTKMYVIIDITLIFKT